MANRFFKLVHKRWRKLCVIGGATVTIPIVTFHAAVHWLPYPDRELRAPVSSTWITDRQNNTIAAFVDTHGDWSLPLSAVQISPHLLDAMVAVEDQRFYQHHGVDWQSAASALWQDARSLHFRRGASTITMQLEHLRGPQNRSLFNKLMQSIRASQIERQQSKQQILVEYLNRAPFGGNLTGAGAASWRYFGRRCADLSLGQAALLAGLPQNPNRLRPDRFPTAATSRRNHVLDRMVACGFITDAERKEAAAEPIDAGWKPLPQESPAEMELVPTLDRLAMEHPGQTVRTTIDPAVQREAASAAADQLKTLAASHVTAAAVVVLDTQTGQCLAAVSRSDDSSKQPKALDLTVRPRSSGSTLKPFIYAAAFDAGIATPQTMVDDSPVAWAGYEPSNYDREFSGSMLAADALAQSRNVPALVLLSKVRVDNAVSIMQGCGLRTLSKTPDRFGLSLVIGGAEVTPMELAQAYATIGRGGTRLDVRLIAEAACPAQSGTILRKSSCLQALQCIASPERTRRICPEAAELAPAWKTGTSSGHRDAWCAAVTPRRTVVVWLGNTDSSGSDALIGQDAAAPIALRIIAAIDSDHEGEIAGFAPPADFLTRAKLTAARAESTQISMMSPVDRETVLVDPALPIDQRRVALRARILNPAQEMNQLWWLIDSQYLGVCKSGEVLWWEPTPGPHEVRVVNFNGQAAKADVEVIRPR